MSTFFRGFCLFALCFVILTAQIGFGQSSNATLTGVVSDPAGAVVPGAEVKLTNTATGTVTSLSTATDGLFSFPNLQQSTYDLQVAAKGFRDFVQKGITVHLNESVRVPVMLQVGTAEQTIEVVADASTLNFETGEVKGAIARTEIETLPLQVAGGQRSAAVFVTLLPGVNAGGTADAFTARFNGGQLFVDACPFMTIFGLSLDHDPIGVLDWCPEWCIDRFTPLWNECVKFYRDYPDSSILHVSLDRFRSIAQATSISAIVQTAGSARWREE